jgi:hypothetical protein
MPGGRALSKKQQKRDLKRIQQQQQQQLSSRDVNAPSKNGPVHSCIASNGGGKEGGTATSHASTSVYKRANKYPKPFPPPGSSSAYIDAVPKGRFVTPADACYSALLWCSYEGFAVESDDSAFVAGANAAALSNLPPMKEATHNRFLRTLSGLESDGYYKFDVNQPMGLGTKLSRTFVSRCVVGDAGITYKYLGTRIFAYPWTDGEEGASEHCVALRELNAELVDRTRACLGSLGRPEVGSCQYNLVLINR